MRRRQKIDRIQGNEGGTNFPIAVEVERDAEMNEELTEVAHRRTTGVVLRFADGYGTKSREVLMPVAAAEALSNALRQAVVAVRNLPDINRTEEDR